MSTWGVLHSWNRGSTALSERRHSVGSGLLWDRESANSLLAPGLCITLTMLDLEINHWTSMYASRRVLETTPSCLYTTLWAYCQTRSRCLVEDFLLQMQEGQADCPEFLTH